MEQAGSGSQQHHGEGGRIVKERGDGDGDGDGVGQAAKGHMALCR